MMPLSVRALVAVLVAHAGGGCAKSTPEPSTSSIVDAGTALAAPQAVASSSPAPSALSPAFQSIAERFAFEAKDRPVGTPRAEDVFAAFEKEGTKFTEKSQHAGGVYGAKFCMGAKAQDDLHMSVCEFASDADVQAGKDLSNRMFGAVPDRASYVRKHSILILRQAVKTQASEARAKKLVDVFAAL